MRMRKQTTYCSPDYDQEIDDADSCGDHDCKTCHVAIYGTEECEEDEDDDAGCECGAPSMYEEDKYPDCDKTCSGYKCTYGCGTCFGPKHD